MSKLRWILGALILLGIIALVIVLPFKSVFFQQNTTEIGFIGRVIYILILSALLVLFRVLRGPTAADRIVAIDIFGILIVGRGLIGAAVQRIHGYRSGYSVHADG